MTTLNWEKRYHALGGHLHSMGRDGTLLFLWVLASAIVVAVAVGLTWQTANHLLRQELRATALDWATYLVDNVDDLEQVMTTGRFPTKALRSWSLPVASAMFFATNSSTIVEKASSRPMAIAVTT